MHGSELISHLLSNFFALNKYIRHIIILLFVMIPFSAISEVNKNVDSEGPPQIGNFALPWSQQPGPLFSFGQNIIHKNQLQFFTSPLYQKATDGKSIIMLNSLLYGITDYNSLLITLPYAADLVEESQHSSGFQDTNFQFEQSIFSTENKDFLQDATVLFGLYVPTGSYQKTPSTGDGSYSFFLGTTYTQTYVDWIWFVASGLRMKDSFITPLDDEYPRIKEGSDFFYQGGLEYNIYSVPNQSEFVAVLELDGTYTNKTRQTGVFDENTGGNTIFVTPSLWYSTQKLILQFGVSLPIVQNLNGDQPSTNYLVIGTLGWTFN